MLNREPSTRNVSTALTAPEAEFSTWTMVAHSLTRPYRVSMAMILLVSLVPCYIFIAAEMPGRTLHIPALPLDNMVPLRPAWALVYGPLYLFLILLPVFVVRQQDHIRRTVLAYLMVWLVAYACFLTYPTIAPRPANVIGSGFAVWGLRFLYGADPPYNCFPSLHVAHSFVSALTCFPVHRGVAVAATVGASLVGLSTVYTKQHYILDVVGGVFLACVAYVVFLRSYPRQDVLELDRRLAPVFALGIVAIVAIAAACFWVAYQFSDAA